LGVRFFQGDSFSLFSLPSYLERCVSAGYAFFVSLFLLRLPFSGSDRVFGLRDGSLSLELVCRPASPLLYVHLVACVSLLLYLLAPADMTNARHFFESGCFDTLDALFALFRLVRHRRCPSILVFLCPPGCMIENSTLLPFPNFLLSRWMQQGVFFGNDLEVVKRRRSATHCARCFSRSSFSGW